MIYGVKDQSKIDFVKRIVAKKIIETKLCTTPACHLLSYKLNKQLSGITILKALRGEFTYRTVSIMIGAGWFTREEFSGNKNSNPPNPPPTSNKNYKRNDDKAENDRQKAIFKRGYQAGYSSGYSAGVDAERRKKPISSGTFSVSELKTDKIRSLLNLNLENGATIGEVTAARNAVGTILSAWIKDKYKQTVEVCVK